MDYEELRKMTVIKLREEAHKLTDVKGVSAMKKDQLIELLCEKLGIETKKPEILPLNKTEIKKRIKELKSKRLEALAKKDRKNAIFYKRRIHAYKRRLRKSIREALKQA